MNAFFIAPAAAGSRCARSPRPTRRWSSASSSWRKIQAELGRPPDGPLGRHHRSQPAQSRSNLDALFAIPTAAITLETTIGLRADRRRSVCYRAAAGPAFQQTQDDVVALLDADPAPRRSR